MLFGIVIWSLRLLSVFVCANVLCCSLCALSFVLGMCSWAHFNRCVRSGGPFNSLETYFCGPPAKYEQQCRGITIYRLDLVRSVSKGAQPRLQPAISDNGHIRITSRIFTYPSNEHRPTPHPHLFLYTQPSAPRPCTYTIKRYSFPTAASTTPFKTGWSPFTDHAEYSFLLAKC